MQISPIILRSVINGLASSENSIYTIIRTPFASICSNNRDPIVLQLTREIGVPGIQRYYLSAARSPLTMNTSGR